MSEVMIDLETLGTGADAVVVSIGVVVFDMEKKEILDKQYHVLSLSDQIKMGRKVDAGTLKFWFNNTTEKAREVFKAETKEVAVALQEMYDLLDKHRPLTIWANGTDFDLSIMQNLHEMYDKKIAWAYNRKNDLRTFIRFVGNGEKLPQTDGDHNALSDALKQVEYIFKHYKKEKEV